MSDRVLTAANGAIFIQPNGANRQEYYLGCHDVADIVSPESAIELIRCRTPQGGFKVVGEKDSPPEKVTTSLVGLTKKARTWLEVVKCPFNLYFLQRDCGNADNFTNYVRMVILMNSRKNQTTWQNLVKREASDESMKSFDIEAWPPVLEVVPLNVSRITTTELLAVTDITGNKDLRCIGACGTSLGVGDDLWASLTSAVAPAFGHVAHSTDNGLTWAATAAFPFAAGLTVSAIQRFTVGRSTNRILVSVLGAAAAVQGMVAYSDDNGATWTTVNIGGAAAGLGATRGGGLFALDEHHIWLASCSGFIYFSSDGGETWTAQESGLLTAGHYTQIHFLDENYGMAVAAAGIVVATRNGGDTWQLVTAIATVPALLTVQVIDEYRAWVGTATGLIFYTEDWGVTWTGRTGWVGSGVGTVQKLDFLNELIGFMNKNTAGPVGSILRTVDGGFTWEPWTTPTNAGLLGALFACNENCAIAGGSVHAATSLFLRAVE